MTLEELRKKPHLSASSVLSYVDCGYQHKLSKILRCTPEFKPDSMEYGSVIHKTLADFNLSRKDEDGVLSLDDLKDLFREYWALAVKDDETVRYSKGKDYESLLNDGLAMIEMFYEKNPDNGFKLIGAEVPFIFYLDDIPVPIIGGIDLIEADEAETIVITDYKTSSKAYSSAEIDNNDQLTIYQIAAKANGLTKKDMLLRLDVLVKTKTPKFEQYYTVRTEEDENRVKRKIHEVWKGINDGVFIPNTGTWKCKGCLYQKACETTLKEEAYVK